MESEFLLSCDDEKAECKICALKYENPRVLSCLHVFCEKCLKEQLESTDNAENVIECPTCEQETKLGAKGVAGLPLDYISCNQLDLEDIKKTQIICTSCRAKDNAVARCTECASFLCDNCVAAHKLMRCFENHTVVSFDELKSDENLTTLHKPITCTTHKDVVLKYYCHTCHIPICSECMSIDHKQPEHFCEKAQEAEHKQREELKNLIAEGKNKLGLSFPDPENTDLDAQLSDLQMQRDNAKSHIEETFHSYKAKLEELKENSLNQLNSIHSAQELHVMEIYHNIEKTRDQITDACAFAERLLDKGNTLETLSITHMVSSQLMRLMNNIPKTDISVGIAFETDAKKFEDGIKENFGTIVQPKPLVKSENSPLSTKTSPMHSHSSLESDILSLSTSVTSPESTLPSLDVDLGCTIAGNLKLSDVPETSIGLNSSAASPPVNFSDLLRTTDDGMTEAEINTLNNLLALAKMSSLSDGATATNDFPALSLQPEPLLNSPISRYDDSFGSFSRSSRTPDIPDSFFSSGNKTSRVNSPLGLMAGLNTLGMMPPSPTIKSTPTPMLTIDTFNASPRSSTVKLNTMQIRCKFGQLGNFKGQLSSPHGFCLGLDEEIVVADTNNHRIQVFEKTGDYKYQFGTSGKEEGHLWYPRKVAVIHSTGEFVICDRGTDRSRMQIFSKSGQFLKTISIRYIDIVAGLAITSENNIVAVDSVAPTIFIISRNGDLLHWFDCSTFMKEPSDLVVSNREIYVCDFKGHCIMVFSEKGEFLRKIGGEEITNYPNGVEVSDAGDILVGDSHGNRFHVVVFSREGTLLSEFECPYIKVSRCCGLKITSEGYVVTLAKNNHHVLVLNTLYIV